MDSTTPGNCSLVVPVPTYQELGLRTFINAAGTYTRLGGSRMPGVVVQAMAEAAQHFVDIDELQAQVGTRIAALTHNEAAYVTSGAAAGLLLATAACIAGTDPGRARQLPNLQGMRDQVIMHRAHRNPYDYALRTLPIQIVEIGFPTDIVPIQEWELKHAMSERTAAVHYVVSGWTPSGALQLEVVLAIAHQHGVPVIIDAAAQLPPRENLWRFTGMGADLVVFSGGKDLCGPQSSGLIVGKRELIAACALIGAPHHGIGRPLKVGKEELMGLLAAVQWYMARDEEERARRAEELVAALIEQLGGPGLLVERSFPNEAGQPVARASVRFLGERAEVKCARAVALLRGGNPSIEVGPAGLDGFYVNPMTVEDDEVALVLGRMRACVRPSGGD